MNGHIYFEIQADDPGRAKHFYGQLFDWKFIEVHGLPVEYWNIDTGGSWGGLLKRPANAPPAEDGANAFVCSIEVEDFDMATRKMTELGAKIALPKFAVPGKCWQGYFIDTEGNTFGIFQVDASAQ